MRIPSSETLIRAAVIIDVAGLLLLVGVLVRISALNVGLFMLGSALLTIGIVMYLVAVLRNLRRHKAL